MRDYFTIWCGPFLTVTWTAFWSRNGDVCARYKPAVVRDDGYTYLCCLGFEVSLLWSNL